MDELYCDAIDLDVMSRLLVCFEITPLLPYLNLLCDDSVHSSMIILVP